MAAPAFLSPLANFLFFLRDHAKLFSLLLLLFLSPPIHRILLYFTPLLLSTALCIFALITLAPYVTATDAEVERQSLLGVRSHHERKSKSSSITDLTNKRAKEAGDSENSVVSSSALTSASSSAFSLSETATRAASSPVVLPPSPTSENSWMSWMKGLNDIGREWMESKLSERGLALSEPANRETLLALIEGSFAELVTVKENYTEVFAERRNDATTADQNLMVPIDMDDGSTMGDQSTGIDNEPVPPVPKESTPSEAGRLADNVAVDARADESVSKELCLSHTDLSAADSQESCITGAGSRESKEGSEKINSVPIVDADIYVPQTSTILPETPSRMPCSSKLFEASRRIFMKEEQLRSMLPRAPSQLPGDAQPSKPSTGSSMQGVVNHIASTMRSPARKFSMDRFKATAGKEGGNTDDSGISHGERSLVETVLNGMPDRAHDIVNDAGDFKAESNVEGPHFDEDLEVEEAQALVQSELKMLEVELDEVAAKLRKTREMSYQKMTTPARWTLTGAPASSPAPTPARRISNLF